MGLLSKLLLKLSTKGYHDLGQYDSSESTDLDANRIRSNPILRHIYEEKYRSMVQVMVKFGQTDGGLLLELGSGGGFFKEMLPGLITSDFKPLSYVDRVINAEKLPFENNALKAIFAMHLFHHLPDVRSFLKEVIRCLKPGGLLILIEPNDGPFASFIFKHAHPEPFNKKAKTWELESYGPASASNQALAFLVFKRDRALFEREFPELEIVQIEPNTFLEYLTSGGVVYRQLVPTGMFPMIRWMDQKLHPLMPLLGLHQLIVVRKKRIDYTFRHNIRA